MTEGQAELIRYRLSRAKETLKEANELVKSGLLHGATNRIYYACFYSVVALILTKSLSSSKHSGVLGLFNKNFVKTGIIPKEMGKFYSRMFDNRLESDYGELIDIEPDEIIKDLAAAAEFLDLIAAVIANK